MAEVSKQSTKPIRVAFGSVPKDSGTFTFYRNMRPALAARGINLYCVTVGKPQAGLWEEAYVDDGCVLLAENSLSMKRQAQAFTSWCVENDIDCALAINSEGVLFSTPHLPSIVEDLSAFGVPFRLRIAGKGVDRARLVEALAPYVSGGRVEFVGALPPHEVPKFLGGSDVFIFTSHFEGCPNALLEAMMAGCVPTCGLIPGITDFLVEDGRTGFVVDLGDSEGFAKAIAALNDDRAKLAALSQAVGIEARAQYSNEVAADAYAALIQDVMSEPPVGWTPRPWNMFEPDPNFPGYWRNRIPPSLRAFVRKFR